MRYAAGTCDYDFDVRKLESEISMDQFPETALLVDSAELELTGAVSICHDAIMGTYDTGKESESDDPGTICMFEAFIVDECDPMSEYGTEQVPVMWLLLSGMRKKQISLVWDQHRNRYFLDPQQDVAAGHILPEFDTCPLIFPIRKASIR
jgi:hypothetical protein